MADFYFHSRECVCYACSTPICFIIACKTAFLEASTYFRAGENDIAKNYFDGALDMVRYTEGRLGIVKEKFAVYEDFVVDNVLKGYLNELRVIEIDLLIEMSFFHMKMNDFDAVDVNLVRIYELKKEYGESNLYLNSEINNLIMAYASFKRGDKKATKIDDLDEEFDKMHLADAKTPDGKTKIPKEETKKIVKDEEVFKKRKVIKLNLDEDDKDFEVPKRNLKPKKPEFKVPEPKVTKVSLELATPVKTVNIPEIVITQPSGEEISNNTDKEASSQSPEQFFTPMTSVKTYKKKTLRQNIVKKLESEFSTPKAPVKISSQNMNTTNEVFSTPINNTLNLTERHSKTVNLTKESYSSSTRIANKGSNSSQKPTKLVENDQDDFATPIVKDALKLPKRSSRNKDRSSNKDTSKDTKSLDKDSTSSKPKSKDSSSTKYTQKDSSITPKDSSVTPKDSSVTPKDSSVTPKDSASSQDTSKIPLRCQNKKREALKRATSPGKLSPPGKSNIRTRTRKADRDNS